MSELNKWSVAFATLLCAVVLYLHTSHKVDSMKERVKTCHTILYSVYGEVQTAECVDNFNIGYDNGIVSYSQDGLTIYVRPDLLAVKEHTHE